MEAKVQSSKHMGHKMTDSSGETGGMEQEIW